MNIKIKIKATRTILCIERSWLRKINSKTKSFTKDGISITKRRLKKRICQRLKKRCTLKNIYAVCIKNRILYIECRSKDGIKSRYYDILQLHKKAYITTKTREVYTEAYLRLLEKRYESHYRYHCKKLFNKNINVMIELWKEQLNKSTEWVYNQAIIYFNRHWALIANNKPLIINKTVIIEEENDKQVYKIEYEEYKERDFLKTFGRKSIGYSKSSISEAWYESYKQKRYNSIPKSRIVKSEKKEKETTKELDSLETWWLELLETDSEVLYGRVIQKKLIYEYYSGWREEKGIQEEIQTRKEFWNKIRMVLGNEYKEIKPINELESLCIVVPTREVCKDAFNVYLSGIKET